MSVKNRLEIVSIYVEHNSHTCYLKLKKEGQSIEKKVSGSVEQPITAVVAGAMIKIIKQYTKFKGIIEIENIFQTGIEDEILVVQLNFQESKEAHKERLVGAVHIEHNLPLATGKAVLKAVNRRINC